MALRTPSSPHRQPASTAAPIVLRDRWWWAPIAALYGWAIRLRHALYDRGLKSSRPGALPTVVLGNVTVGGTGKTPHLKVLLQRLMDADKDVRWAVLSRGYGRKTKGFLQVDRSGAPDEFGDEALEVARKFPGVPVYVCEDRLQGLERIGQSGLADAVLLDDGLQHRRLKPTVGITLVDTTQPVDRDHFLPRGRLRDLPSRVSDTEAVILTRCPAALTKGDLRLWRHRLQLRPDQHLLHTGTRAEGLRDLTTKRYAGWPMGCIAVSGIAQPAQFEAQIGRHCRIHRHFAYPDHQDFSEAHFAEWRAALDTRDERGQQPEAIITTEKDAERIRPFAQAADLPILVQNLHIHWWDQDALDQLLSTLRKRVEASRSNSDI